MPVCFRRDCHASRFTEEICLMGILNGEKGERFAREIPPTNSPSRRCSRYISIVQYFRARLELFFFPLAVLQFVPRALFSRGNKGMPRLATLPLPSGEST